jgi:hypothetical protein
MFQGNCFLNPWDLSNYDNNTHVEIRYHWLNIDLSSVWYRCLFNTPFLYYDDFNIKWKCYHDDSYSFGSKMSSQLARQNIISNDKTNKIPLKIESLNIHWKIVDYPVKPLNHILINPTLVTSDILNQLNNF